MNLKCPSCGTVFPQMLFSSNSTVKLELQDVAQACPKCGFPVTFKNGKYDIKNGRWTFLENLSKKNLRALEGIVAHAYSNNFTEAAFYQEVDSKYPELTQFLKGAIDLSKNSNFRYWMKYVLTLIGIILGGAAIQDTNIEINIGNTTNNETQVYPQSSNSGESYSKRMERTQREKRLKEIKEKQTKKSAKSKSKNK